MARPTAKQDPDKTRGVYRKFDVKRTDAGAQARHAKCDYYVLDVRCDKYAKAALIAYADACEAEYPHLAADIRLMAEHDWSVREFGA